MNINYETVDNILIVSLNGELDHHSSQKVRKEIDKAIDSFFIKNLVFDFEQVSFMDSSGIGVVIGRYNKIKKLGGETGVINCNEYINKIFEMSGLFTIIQKYQGKNEAISNIN